MAKINIEVKTPVFVQEPPKDRLKKLYLHTREQAQRAFEDELPIYDEIIPLPTGNKTVYFVLVEVVDK